MRIKEIRVDGFGGVGPLHLTFSPGLNVILGPNEAGKTCLMEFIRAMFLGLPRRDPRARQYEPLDGRPFGGRMVLEEGEKEWVCVGRFPGVPKVEGGDMPFSPETANLLFSRVFSLGLAQVSNLALLAGDEMARHLYSTALGPLGKAYSRAVEELEKRRKDLYKPRGRTPEVNRLLGEVRAVEGELLQLRDLPERYRGLLDRLEEVEKELGRVTGEWTRVSQEQREWDTLARAYPLWVRLREVQVQLEKGDFPHSFPSQGLERMEELERDLKAVEEDLEGTNQGLAPLEEALGRPLEGTKILEMEKEITALKEDWSLVKGQKERLVQIRERVARLDREEEEGLSILGLESLPPRPTEVVWEELRGFAERFSLLEKERLSLEKELEVREEERDKKEKELEELRQGEPPKPLFPRDEVLARQDFISLARDHLFATPTWWQMGFSLFFLFLGGCGLGVGLHFGLPLVKWVGVGLLLVGGAGVGLDILKRFKWRAEARRLAQRLDIEHLDRSVLDDLSETLKVMEDGWRAVDYWRIKCSDAERSLRLAVKDMDRIRESLGGLEEREATLKKEWNGWLEGLGLPTGLSPQEVQDLLHKLEEIHRCRREREDLLKEERGLEGKVAGFQARVERVMGALGLEMTSLEDGMATLSRLLDRALGELEERRKLESKATPLREKVKFLLEVREKKKKELEELLREAGAENREEFRRMGGRWREKVSLEEEARELSLQLEAILGKDWRDKGDRLDALESSQAVARASELAEREKALREERDALIEIRTRLLREKEEMEGEGREQVLVHRREELVDRLREAVLEWTVETLALTLFVKTREVYERENQPRVLRDASRFFATMTGERYRRVYIPMGSQDLWVEREDGMTLSSRFLSRGTGEQLYLALSMAIMLEVAQKGLAFPVVFDDILVNFDPGRAARAAEAIGALADRLQVLFFTCHPQMGELLASVGGAEVRSLEGLSRSSS